MDLGSLLAGAAAFCTAIAALITALVKSKKDKIDEVCKDISVIKEATYYALHGVVELGANGDAKKAQERLKKNIFKEEN